MPLLLHQHPLGQETVAPQYPIEKVGEQLRTMMSWIKQNALVDKSKN